MKYLITGATGFIGTALCSKLQQNGADIIALSRSGSAPAGGCESVALDLSVQPVPESLLQDVDVVFHLAGIAHQQAVATAYDALNVKATLALANSAEKAGVKHFVFLSSVKAMGAATDPSEQTVQRSEQDCYPVDDPYGESKWRAECALSEQFEHSAMAVSIIRPALVYGPKPRGNLQLLAKGIRFGLPRPPVDGGRSMVGRDDLVSLLLKLVDHPLLKSENKVNTWIVTDGKQYSTRDVYDLLRSQQGKPVAKSWLPRWSWWLACKLLDKGKPRSHSLWQKMFCTELYDNDKVCRELNWQPQYSLYDKQEIESS